MSNKVIKFKKLDKEAVLPAYQREGDAAFDVYSLEGRSIQPKTFEIFTTGVASEIPPGHFVSLRDRSGMAAKNGIFVLGGVIDANYRGEWKVILANFAEEPYQVNRGDRIVQGVFHRLPGAEIVEVDELSDSARAEKGFGSSGK